MQIVIDKVFVFKIPNLISNGGSEVTVSFTASWTATC